jgi:hypothetical protein
MQRSHSLSSIEQTGGNFAIHAKTALPRSTSYCQLESIRERQNLAPKSTFLRLNSRLSLALFDKQQAASIAHHELNKSHILVGVDIAPKSKIESADISAAPPATLEEIYKFDEKLNTFCRQNAVVNVVVYTGLEIERQIKIIFLMGCHLIMKFDIKAQEVLFRFKAVDNWEDSEFSLHQYWVALDNAKETRCINFKETFDSENYASDCIAMDEYLHYAR